MNIYVGNLSFSVTEDELKKAFSKFGEVASVQVITDGFTGKPKGFGFITMPNQTEAEAAIKGLNETSLDGRNIIVNQARPKTERPAQQRRSRY
jgi:RNA recognition motif-containing protein